MPRVAFSLLCLALGGCGYSTWSNPPFSSGTNPHFPVGDSENMRRVTGEQVDTPFWTIEYDFVLAPEGATADASAKEAVPA